MIEDSWRKQEEKERFLKSWGRENGQFSKGEGAGFGDKEGDRGEEGIFHEIQTSGLNIDSWQNTRTNHYGLICELRDKKTATAKWLPALSKSSQSNLVSSPDRVIRLGDQQIWISASPLTELLGIFLWTRWRNGGIRAQLSALVTGWTSIFKVLINRAMSPWQETWALFCSARPSVAWIVLYEACLLEHWRA